MDKKNFTHKYNEILKRRKGIIQISDESINSIQDSLEEYQKLDTRLFVMVTFIAIFFLATAPAFFSFFSDLIQKLIPDFKSALSLKEYIKNNSYISVSAILILFCVPFYTIIMPSVKLSFYKLVSDFTLLRRGFSYFSYTIILNYLVLIIPLTYVISFDLMSDWLLEKVIFTWLILPGIIFSFIPSLVLMIFLIIVSDRFSSDDEKSHLLPAVIIEQLTLLLEELENHDEQEFGPKNINKSLNSRILKISSLIKEMGDNFDDVSAINRYLVKRFDDASNAFRSLNICISLPESSSKMLLRRKVESVLNTFLSGNYSDLPKTSFVPYQYIKYKRRVGIVKNMLSLAALGLFLSLPILLWAIVLWAYNPTIVPSIQALLPIFYIIWCMVGILSFSAKLAPEVKDVIKDVFKLVITKK